MVDECVNCTVETQAKKDYDKNDCTILKHEGVTLHKRWWNQSPHYMYCGLSCRQIMDVEMKCGCVRFDLTFRVKVYRKRGAFALKHNLVQVRRRFSVDSTYLTDRKCWMSANTKRCRVHKNTVCIIIPPSILLLVLMTLVCISFPC